MGSGHSTPRAENMGAATAAADDEDDDDVDDVVGGGDVVTEVELGILFVPTRLD